MLTLNIDVNPTLNIDVNPILFSTKMQRLYDIISNVNLMLHRLLVPAGVVRCSKFSHLIVPERNQGVEWVIQLIGPKFLQSLAATYWHNNVTC